MRTYVGTRCVVFFRPGRLASSPSFLTDHGSGLEAVESSELVGPDLSADKINRPRIALSLVTRTCAQCDPSQYIMLKNITAQYEYVGTVQFTLEMDLTATGLN